MKIKYFLFLCLKLKMSDVKQILTDIKSTKPYKNDGSIWLNLDDNTRAKLNKNYDKYGKFREIADFIYTVHRDDIHQKVNELFPNDADVILALFNDEYEMKFLEAKYNNLKTHYDNLYSLINKYGFDEVANAINTWHENYGSVNYRIYEDHVFDNKNVSFGSDDGAHYFSESIAYYPDAVDEFLSLTTTELINDSESERKVNEIVQTYKEDYSIIHSIDSDDIRLLK